MAANSNAGRIGIWGASGSGKSAYTKRRIKTARRVVVFDPLDEYGFKRVSRLDDVRRAMIADPHIFKVSYVPPAGKEPAALSGLCNLLMRAQKPYKDTGKGQGITLVIEEMNLSFPVAGGAQKCPGFAEICSRGRHYGIEVIGISQRIAEVSTRFRGNCTETVVFRQKGPRDQEAAAAELGCHKSKLPAENLQYLEAKAGQLRGPLRLRF
jgi:DNA helicase HerA-like ATPase